MNRSISIIALFCGCFFLNASCMAGKTCTRHSDCERGLICGITGECVIPPDAAPDDDGGLLQDALGGDAVASDGGIGDASLVDGGGLGDASLDDGGSADAGPDAGVDPLELPVKLPNPTFSDGGLIDAALPDASPEPDAALPDAGELLDSGILLPDADTQPVDAQTPLLDGGVLVPDASESPDASDVLDSGILLPDSAPLVDADLIDASEIGDFPVLP